MTGEEASMVAIPSLTRIYRLFPRLVRRYTPLSTSEGDIAGVDVRLWCVRHALIEALEVEVVLTRLLVPVFHADAHITTITHLCREVRYSDLVHLLGHTPTHGDHILDEATHLFDCASLVVLREEPSLRQPPPPVGSIRTY